MEQNSPWAITGWVVGLLAFFGVVIRQLGPWRKQITETEERLRKELSEALKTERQEHQKERLELREAIVRLETKITEERILHNAERALDRHRLNNITACFDAMLLLVETNPDKASEIVVKIKDMRAAQILAEAEEKAIIRAAELTAKDREHDHDGN